MERLAERKTPNTSPAKDDSKAVPIEIDEQETNPPCQFKWWDTKPVLKRSNAGYVPKETVWKEISNEEETIPVLTTDGVKTYKIKTTISVEEEVSGEEIPQIIQAIEKILIEDVSSEGSQSDDEAENDTVQ